MAIRDLLINKHCQLYILPFSKKKISLTMAPNGRAETCSWGIWLKIYFNNCLIESCVRLHILYFILCRVIKMSLCTWWLYCNRQVHRGFLIALYYYWNTTVMSHLENYITFLTSTFKNVTHAGIRRALFFYNVYVAATGKITHFCPVILRLHPVM